MKKSKNSIDLKDIITLCHENSLISFECRRQSNLNLSSFLDDDELGYLSDEITIDDRLVLTKGVFMEDHFLYRFESWSCIFTSSEDKELRSNLDECTSWNKLCHYYLGRIIEVEEYKERLYNVTFKVLSDFINKALYTDHDGNVHGDGWDWSRPISILQTALNLFSIYKLDRDRLLYEIRLYSFTDRKYINWEVSLLIYMLQASNWRREDMFDVLYKFKERQWRIRWDCSDSTYSYSLNRSLYICTELS